MPKQRNHKLLDFIQRQHLNQTSFADAIGVNRQTVISWINRTKGVSLSSLYAIATRFGMTPTDANEELDLGVEFTEVDTEVEKLQTRLRKLETWFTLPDAETLSKEPAFDTRNFIIGSLDNRNLCTLDVLTETAMTVNSWRHFMKTGQLDKEICDDLLDWLGINLPTNLSLANPEEVSEAPDASKTDASRTPKTDAPRTPKIRRRSSFSTSSRS